MKEATLVNRIIQAKIGVGGKERKTYHAIVC